MWAPPRALLLNILSIMRELIHSSDPHAWLMARRRARARRGRRRRAALADIACLAPSPRLREAYIAHQSVGMGVRVCKSVCIEMKISGRGYLADHRNFVLRFTLMTQHNQ